jgi:NADPH:quinone reductase-like Zn-dependent oxidoreductase
MRQRRLTARASPDPKPAAVHQPYGGGPVRQPRSDLFYLRATTGLTARALMTTAKVQPGETVLVIGATGGVGTALIQLLAAAKARVIATATTANAGLLRALGATAIIGYAEASYPSGADAAFNLTLPSDQLTGLARAIRPGGRLLTITYPVPEQEWIGRDNVVLHFVLDMDGTLGGMREVGN